MIQVSLLIWFYKQNLEIIEASHSRLNTLNQYTFLYLSIPMIMKSGSRCNHNSVDNSIFQGSGVLCGGGGWGMCVCVCFVLQWYSLRSLGCVLLIFWFQNTVPSLIIHCRDLQIPNQVHFNGFSWSCLKFTYPRLRCWTLWSLGFVRSATIIVPYTGTYSTTFHGGQVCTSATCTTSMVLLSNY